jgi:hypothetical protein
MVSLLKYFDDELNLINRLGEVLKTIYRYFLLRLDQYTVLFENRRKHRYLMTFVYNSTVYFILCTLTLCG